MRFSASRLCLAVSASSALLLAACGGGGSDGGPPFTPSTITSANAKDVSAQMMAANSVYSQQATAGNALLTGVSVSTSRTGLLKASLQQLYKGLEAKSAGNMVTGVESSVTVYCTGGGTLFTSGTYANPPNLSNGDRFSMSANNCVEGGIKFNGGLSFEFSNLSGAPHPSAPWGATMVMRFSQFTLEAGGEFMRANGDLTLSYNQTSDTQTTGTLATASATSSSLRVTLMRQGATVGDYTYSNTAYAGSLNGYLYEDSYDFALTGIIGKLGNTSFTVKTTRPFKGTAGWYPTQGSMKITASDKTTATLTADPDGNTVWIDLDKNADGVTDEAIITSWFELESRL